MGQDSLEAGSAMAVQPADYPSMRCRAVLSQRAVPYHPVLSNEDVEELGKGSWIQAARMGPWDHDLANTAADWAHLEDVRVLLSRMGLTARARLIQEEHRISVAEFGQRFDRAL